MKSHQTPFSMSSYASVLWFPVGALAALQGTFTLSWVVYRAHLPGMLGQFNFPADMAPKILLIEALLAIVIEPLAGLWSDRTQQQRGSRFPMIWIGIGLTALVTIGLPILLGSIAPVGALRWWLPGLLLLWGTVMSLARTPAIALLKQYASTRYLPIAASLLTFAGGLAGAVTPLGRSAVLDLGITLTFVAMAILLLGVTAVLQLANTAPPVAPLDAESATHPVRSPWSTFGAIFGLGFGTTFVFRLIIETFPKILQPYLAEGHPPLMLGIVFLGLALAALMAGRLALQFGNRRLMIVGLAGLAAGLGLLVATVNGWMAVVAAFTIAIFYSFIANGTFPLTLSLVSAGKAGLAIGLFFSGVSFAASLFGLFGASFSQPSMLIPLGFIALLITGVCISVSRASTTATE